MPLPMTNKMKLLLDQMVAAANKTVNQPTRLTDKQLTVQESTCMNVVAQTRVAFAFLKRRRSEKQAPSAGFTLSGANVLRARIGIRRRDSFESRLIVAPS